jgi:hypothetical protein
MMLIIPLNIGYWSVYEIIIVEACQYDNLRFTTQQFDAIMLKD